MTQVQQGTLLRQLRRMVHSQELADLSDQELLHRFIAGREEAAFHMLVTRHGPMVLQVGRRVYGNEQDAEDVFQATFLVLARKAAAIRKPAALASWLHGVAHRLALDARDQHLRRRARERLAADMRPDAPPSEQAWRELQAALDAALQKLPETYRAPLLLCYLEGRTQEEAAQLLSCPLGTVRSRLARGRSRLRTLLERQGIRLSATALVATLLGSSASAAVVPSLVQNTTQAALTTAAGAIPEALVSKRVQLLLQRGLRTLGKARLGFVTLLLLVLGSSALAAMLLTGHAPEETPHAAKEEQPPTIITGRVLRPDGRPAAGAFVFLLARTPVGGARAAARVATADADGRFTVDTNAMPAGAREAILLAGLEGLAPDWMNLADKPRAVELTLAEDVPLTGRLLDLEGKPIAGAVVKLLQICAVADGNLQPVFNAMRINPEWLHFQKYLVPLEYPGVVGYKTDADGRFTIRGVGRNRVAVLRFEAPGIEAARVHVVAQPEFDPKAVTPRPEEREIVKSGFVPGLRLAIHGPVFTHTARPSHDIHGTVTDAVTGKPIHHVRIVGTASATYANGEPDWNNAIEVRSDAEGHFRLTGLPKAARRFLHIQPEHQPYLNRLVEINDVEGLAPVKVDAVLQPAVLVEGQLLDKTTAQPVQGDVHYLHLTENLWVKTHPDGKLYKGGLFSGRPTGTTTATDDEGRFRLRVPPGPGVLLARADTERQPTARYAPIRVAAEDRKYLRQPTPGAISTLMVAGAKTRDRSQDDESFATGVLSWPLRWENGYALIRPTLEDKTVSVAIRFDPGVSITGRLVGPDNNPVRGAQVAGLFATNEFRATTLPSDTFTVQAMLPGGERELVFLHPDKKLVGMLTVKVEDKDLVVRLQPWGTITGQVLTPTGEPAPEAQINYQFVDGRVDELIRQRLYRNKLGAGFQIDKTGHFRLEGLFPGQEVWISASTPGFRFGKGSSPVIPEAGKTLDIGSLQLPSNRK